MLPDFNRLRIFYHIYKEKSSAAAANSLHITPSGVSQHLKKLEEELQMKLFTRVNRGLVPTAAGHKLFEVVQSFITELEERLDSFDICGDTPAGRLKIGAPAEFGRTYMPKIFAAFRRQYPSVSLHLELADPNELFGKVGSGELDFAYIDILPIFLEAPGGLNTYDIEPILREELILACSKSYYEESIVGVTYNDLISLDYVGYKTDVSLFNSWFAMHFGREVATLNLSLIVDSAGAVISAMEEGLGLGIIVSHLISSQLFTGSLVEVNKDSRKVENTIASVRLRNKDLTITESAFQQFFKDQLRDIVNIFQPLSAP